MLALTGEMITGDVAQLGERMNGIHEVRGSIPLVSTKIRKKTPNEASFLMVWNRSIPPTKDRSQ
jgi:hypothetical protein